MAICLSVLFLAAAPAASLRFWLVWIAFIPLFAVIRSQPLGMAACFGALWGCCFYLFSGYHHPGLAAPCIDVALVACAPCLYVVLSKIFVRYHGYTPLAIALTWIVFELTGAQLGAGRIMPPVEKEIDSIVRVIAGFLGYGFIGFLVAYINAALVSITIEVYLTSGRALQSAFGFGSQPLSISSEVPHFLSYRTIRMKPRAPPMILGKNHHHQRVLIIQH